MPEPRSESSAAWNHGALDLYEDHMLITVHGIRDFGRMASLGDAVAWLSLHGIPIDPATDTVRAGDVRKALSHA